MVIQRGTSWATVSSEPQQQQSQQTHSAPHLLKHNQNYSQGSIRATSVVVTDPNLSSPALRCNVLVPPSATSINSQTIVEWRNPFNMRQVTLANLASSQLALRPSFRTHVPVNRVRGRCVTSTAKSLDILRQNVQTSINKEIDTIIKKYLEKFFQPAVDNIRNNLGSGSVSEEHVRDVCRQILEEAKQMYCSGSHSRGSSPYNELSDSETGSIGEYRFGRPTTRSPLFRKRKESDTDSEASQSARRKKCKARTPGNFPSGRSTPLKQVRGEPIRREGPKWNPSRIVKETLFVMGARANKVMGFGQTRGRLYIKHPGLIKYSGDQEDKEWLSRHNLMPPTGGKAYLMVLQDIQELAETDEYRNNPNLLLHELKGFEAPEFMLRKIRAFVSHMRMDVPDVKKPVGLCEATQPHFNHIIPVTEIHGRLGLECVSSAMTPPATVLDSGPPTPSETLELLECPSVATLASQHSDGSPYLQLSEPSPGSHHHHHHGLVLASHSLGGNNPTMGNHNLTSTYHPDMLLASHATLSALLAGHITSDNSQEGVE